MGKKYKLVAIAVLVFSILSGCSIVGPPKNKEPLTIKVITAYKNEFSRFEEILKKEFPHISYEVIGIIEQVNKEASPTANYTERITELLQQEQADIYFNFNPDFYWKDIQLVDMNTLIQKNEVHLNDIQSQMIPSNRPAYYISPTFDREVLFINQNLLQDHNILFNDSQITWDQVREISQQIKRADSTVMGYEIQGTTSWNNLLTEIAQYNGLNRRSDGGRLVWNLELKAIAENMLNDEASSILRKVEENSGPRNWNNLVFYIGNASTMYSLLANPETSFGWQAASIPQSPNGALYNPYIKTVNIAISDASEQEEQAWELVEYLLSEKSVPDLANIGSTMSFYWQEFVGFPTYLDDLELGTFSLDALKPDSSIPAPALSPSARIVEVLDPELAYNVSQEIDRQFNRVRNKQVTFEQAWEEISILIEGINANSENFLVL
ncbi:ABC transporter substrate-binding protein [Paenibacillus paeoniae]|uniref:Carbohydrate ABC transporter substrate-binding protein n=1 Tax=Paenibacillus paeoniae TaxID=2292705 RepID=A0A371P7D7_9BACL|nr:ABC transporter substrate-binding protein [Paenibacillus paeoniae]REK71430.1 carbohydrate ABC transporter substrate-binding protein [Paenibacillus paeoniae]